MHLRCTPHCAALISQSLHAAPQLRPEALRCCLHKVNLVHRKLPTCLGCSGSASSGPHPLFTAQIIWLILKMSLYRQKCHRAGKTALEV